jgi:hypothetical protein
MTKGARPPLDSKEAFTFVNVCDSSSPALENMIHGVFVVTDLRVSFSDKRACTAPNNAPAD